jgi:methylase of polypeptide subunit release factors
MWLGCHEEELHEVVHQQIARLQALAEPHIVNLGCAEGYYAVGMARRVPNAKVWIVDKDSKAIDIAHKNAAANDVYCRDGDDNLATLG